jgi:hypothetical protein
MIIEIFFFLAWANLTSEEKKLIFKKLNIQILNIIFF